MTSKQNPNSPSWRKHKPKPRVTIDVTLRNDYHFTGYTFRTRWFKPLSRHVIEQCRKTLCNEPGCNCSLGRLKELGPQDCRVRVGFDVRGDEVITLEPVFKIPL